MKVKLLSKKHFIRFAIAWHKSDLKGQKLFLLHSAEGAAEFQQSSKKLFFIAVSYAHVEP